MKPPSTPGRSPNSSFSKSASTEPSSSGSTKSLKRNLRKSFAERVLGELDSTTAGKMQALLAPVKEK